MLAVANFRPGGTCMSPANLSVIALLALIEWRFVFAGLRCRPWVRAISPQQQRHNNLLEEDLRISDPRGVAVIAGNRFENNSDGQAPSTERITQKDICAASLPSPAQRK